MKRSEFGERGGPGGKQPASAVGHLEAINRPGHVVVLAESDFAHHAANRHLVAGAIRWAVRVDVSAGRQALGGVVGHAQPAAGDVRTVQEQVVKTAVALASRLPIAQQHAVGAGRGVEHDLTAFRDQDACVRAALAGLHVLGEDQKLVLRRLDDGVQIATQHECRGLKRLFIRDLDHVDPGKLKLLELEFGFGRLKAGIARDGGCPGGVGCDEPDIECLDTLEPAFLAEIRLGIELVGREMKGLDVAGGDLEQSGFARAEGARRDDDERHAFHDGDSLPSLGAPGLNGDLAEPVDGVGGLSELDFVERGGRELGVGGGLARGKLAGERLPGGDCLVELFFGREALADLEEQPGHAGIEGVLGDEVGPGRACLGELRACQMVAGDHELCVEHRALRVGALGAVRKPGQVALPGGNRLGELLLALEDRADLERGVHGELCPIAPRFGRGKLRGILLQELREGVERFVALSPGEVREPECVCGSNGFGMVGKRGQESPDRCDALVQADVVGGRWDSVGRGDGMKRIRANGGCFLRELGRPEPLDLAGQIGPGAPREQRLIDFLLGIAEPEACSKPVWPGRILLDVELVVFDRARGVAGRHARAPHGEEEACAKCGAFGQLACLGEQVVRRVRVGGDERITGLEQAAGVAMIDFCKLVFPLAGKKPLGLGAGQVFRGRPATRRKLDAGQLIADLDDPSAVGVELDRLFEDLTRNVAVAREALGDPSEVRKVSLLVRRLRLFGQSGEQASGGLVTALLHRVDHFSRDDRRGSSG